MEILDWAQSYLRFNLHGLLNIAAGLFNLAIGIMTFLKNPRSKIHLSFFFLTVVAFSWVFNFGMVSLARNPQDAFRWLGYSYFLGVPYISAFVFIFSQQWSKNEKQAVLVPVSLILATVFMIPMTFFTRSFFTINEFSWGRFSCPLRTPLAQTYYVALLIYFFSFALAAFGNFYKGWNQSTAPHEKAQYRNFLFGIMIGYTGSVDFFVSYAVNIYAFGYLSLTMYTAIIAYTIVKHQFLDIKLVIRRLSFIVLIYGLLMLAVFPLSAWALKHRLADPSANLFSTLFLLGIGMGLVLSLGPLIYAFVERRSLWLRGTLATGLTHELKSPLGVLQGTMDVLREQALGPRINQETVLSYVDMAQKNLDRLESTVKGLLNVAKIQEEKITLEKKDFDLAAAIQHILSIQTPLAEQKNVQIQFEGPLNLFLHADPEKMEQVVSNIISNALKFSDQGTIRVTLKPSEGKIQFSVKDQGPGLSPKDLPKIFDRFYQAKPNSKGTGIGLTIAKAWVEAHGGKIWAESEGEGKGTTVTFTLLV